jgi:hypothetical protein
VRHECRDTRGNLLPVSTTPAVPMGKFTGRVVDTGGEQWLANISANFRKKFEMTLLLFSVAWEKMIDKKNLKNLKQKTRDTVPLQRTFIAWFYLGTSGAYKNL